LLVFFIFLQFVANSEVFIRLLISQRQDEMAGELRAALGDDARYLNILEDGNLQRLLFSDAILFESASDSLKPLGRRVLASVGDALRARAEYDEIQIEGHTDDLPINTTRFPSNWELSSARATAVVRFLEDQAGLLPKVFPMSAVGKSEFAPIDSTQRAANRRIEIVLVYSEKDLRPW
jgi:chemotaxis protein MotB